MFHYVCSHCSYISQKPDYCQTEGCLKKGHPLIECNCENNEHEGILKACLNCGKLCKVEGGCEIIKKEEKN